MTDDPVSIVDNDLVCNHCGKIVVAYERLSAGEPHMRVTALSEGGWVFEAVEMHMTNGMTIPIIPPRALHRCEPDPTADITEFLKEQANGPEQQ